MSDYEDNDDDAGVSDRENSSDCEFESPPKKAKLSSNNSKALHTLSRNNANGRPNSAPLNTTTIVLAGNYPLGLRPLPNPKLLITRLSMPLSAIAPMKFKPLTVKSTGERFVGNGFKQGTILGNRLVATKFMGPAHDPEADDALVLFAPKILSQVELFERTKSSVIGQSAPVQEIPVVVDPVLAKVLRKHQVEGVQFLFDCLTGRKQENAFGCIMADEMGLGKTLQCITVLWTLLRQSPEPGKPTIEKAIIVCPSSLVKNWSNELTKWLGPSRINSLACDHKGGREQSSKDLEQFVSAKGRSIIRPVLIISYESLRGYSDLLSRTEIGLLLCDEGHRLKNADSQTYTSLNGLNAKRRVILTGTPVQNDLVEYYSLLSFAIPNILGTEQDFRKNFENPIQRGRDSEASELDRQKGDEKLKELLTIANKFIIRRTAELLTKFLPVKFEHVVFCKLSPLQLELYKSFCSSPETKKLLNGVGSQPLKAITLLKKLCNHPALGFDFFGKGVFPSGFDPNSCQPQFAGKMLLLHNMLGKIKAASEKIVLISNYTQTLDLFEKMCQANQWGVLRLDGTMTIPKRQKLVDQFNDPLGTKFVFLLSSKAGGCGINLVGANRLVLFDPDWNPANDAQALARVWRGSIEEKIFQRQAHKQALSNSVIDAGDEEGERHFSRDELRKLFILNETTACDTHDTFKCKRCIRGRQVTKPGKMSAGATACDTSAWNHLSVEDMHKMNDSILKDAVGKTGARKHSHAARIQLLDKVFNLVISRLTTYQILVAEIKREYDLIIRSASNHIDEKEYLCSKIQKLICETGTPEMLQNELSKVTSLSYQLKAVSVVNERLKQQHERYDVLFIQHLSSLFLKELAEIRDENQKMNFKFKGKRVFINDWFATKGGDDTIFKELGRKYKNDEFQKLTRDDENDDLSDCDPIEKEQLKDTMKSLQQQIGRVDEKISLYEQELKSFEQKVEELKLGNSYRLKFRISKLIFEQKISLKLSPMRTSLAWSDNVNDRDGNKLPIYDLTFKPDGSQLIVGAGSEIFVYEVAEGELIQTLKAHKDTIFAVDYAADGSRFASGGADKQVIIWSSKMEGILKYSHSDSIQALSHNPITGQVLSCTASDFGLWSPEQKNVQKHKVPARILTASWTHDGQSFALGLFNGHVSIRSRTGEEKVRIERGNVPVWSLQWCPSAERDVDLLAVTDWNQKLAFFQLNGRQVGKERTLGYDPTGVSFFSSGDFVVIGGSDQKVTLWTAEGIKLGVVCERESWVWCCKVKPKQNYVAVGCNDGSISVHQIVFNTVHGLYNDRYAFRENMTDVVIQHLVTDQRARIKCRDYVKKIAIYRDRLAVQLTDRIIIYELFHDDATDMHYRIKEKLQKKLDCNLLVVTSQHIILCLEKKLQMYQFNGDKEREWNLDSLIRYIKAIGGPRGQEGLLVGMKNGQIFQIFVNNPFPIPLLKQQTAIRCLDLNLSRTKLAVVDDHNTCLVYCVKTKELLFQEPNANSVSWNSELDDMLCYSGNGVLNVKTGSFLSHQQKMQGFVVGFKGSRIFSLHIYNMTTVDVPQSTSLERYLEKKEFDMGYKVACLGVTENDWRRLAMESLECLSFDVAKKAFIRLRDSRFLDLLKLIDRMKAEGKYEMDNIVGEINTYVGKFHEAARLFKRAGNHIRAIQMYTDLNMWEYATQIASETNMDPVDILKRKAQIQQDRNDLIAAATTYIEVGDYLQAINIIGPSGAVDRLIEITRKLKKNDTKALSKCLFYFKKYNQHHYAAECLIKMGDISQLLSHHIDLLQWEEAFRIAETYPEFTSQIYLPYATWLAMNDRYIEAQINYRKAGRIDEAVRVLEQLAKNAVTEWRFNDAAYYNHLLSMEYLESILETQSSNKLNDETIDALTAFGKHRATSEVYFAFHSVRKFIDEPFTSHLPESLLSMATFLLNYTMTHSAPPGISKAYILLAITKIARNIGAFKLARYGYERLQHYKIPPEWETLTNIASLTLRGKPSTDREDLLPQCYVCSTVNPMLNSKGDSCIECKEKFIRSLYSFQILPLVEFVLAEGISDSEALTLINKEPTRKRDEYINLSKKKHGKQSKDEEDSENELNRQIEGMNRSGSWLTLTREDLAEVHSRDVFVRDWGKRCVPVRYYKVSHSDASIVMCPKCLHFFMDDEWNYQYLQEGSCHFCRTKLTLID
ncbi:hypothetical protein HK100_002072 [Physocladia obscura]|uniref:Intraflagellar transport protein 122 homolog n=1 Tax=Physocladia obscura TaxID=109957 RepID=A0AAD5T9T0_9FUNG|nr:hypothetical protein HK100_002072 [Physocladia obscura]